MAADAGAALLLLTLVLAAVRWLSLRAMSACVLPASWESMNAISCHYVSVPASRQRLLRHSFCVVIAHNVGLQVGQLSVPGLPQNFRTTAAQLGFIKMDWA